MNKDTKNQGERKRIWYSMKDRAMVARRTSSLLEKLMEKKNEFPKPLINIAHSKYQCCCAWRMRMLLLWLETRLLLLWLLWLQTIATSAGGRRGFSVFARGLDEKKTQWERLDGAREFFL